MNEDQRRVFISVFNSVRERKNVWRKFVSGEAGTGKSFIIKTLIQAVREEVNKDVAVIALTGIAAYNVGGMTMHRLLQLPIEHKRGTPKYYPLADIALNVIRENLKNLALIIVDERSMVSNVNFLYIHFRLQEIFCTYEKVDGWFGMINLLVFGDLLQLPPVFDSSVFIPVSKKRSTNRFSVYHSSICGLFSIMMN